MHHPRNPSERRTRESSYHPMASDSEDGGVSDGDPPFYAGGVSHSTIASSVSGPASSHSLYPARSTTNVDSLAGTTSAPVPGLVSLPIKKPGGTKRNFEELEDIVFSNPKSFASLAFAIAGSRGVTLVVSDDRTHKVSSAYMHITCAYRKSGCPFILKLTKAKEGGWILRGRSVDIKQRSVYRCRHPAGAVPEIIPAPTIAGQPYYAASPSSSQSHSQPPSTVPTPVAPRSKPNAATTRIASGVHGDRDGSEQYEPAASTAATTGAKASPRSRPAAPGAPPVGGYFGNTAGTASPASRLTPMTTGGAGGGSANGTIVPGSAERALAPPFEPSPFERSLQLQSKIVPVLKSEEPSTTSRTNGVPGWRVARDHSLFESDDDDDGDENDQAERSGARSRRHRDDSLLSTVPIIARSDPKSLHDWTRLLRILSDPATSSPHVDTSTAHASIDPIPDLVPLAKVLAHAYMSVTPGQFYAAHTTAAMRLELLEGLPVDRIGVWNKVWAKKVLMTREAGLRWLEIARVSNDMDSGSEEPAHKKRRRQLTEEDPGYDDQEEDGMRDYATRLRDRRRRRRRLRGERSSSTPDFSSGPDEPDPRNR
ncbi:uncharacterized protein JCM15063_000808 [Sporobolomyces koalae]|uniref:uncharacterized protein n=1 Tax=Sporobolomyces koalae TaxID=500713 RepID=UPI003178601F